MTDSHLPQSAIEAVEQIRIDIINFLDHVIPYPQQESITKDELLKEYMQEQKYNNIYKKRLDVFEDFINSNDLP